MSLTMNGIEMEVLGLDLHAILNCVSYLSSLT